MAVVNTITIVKSGGTYADVDEMRTAMRTAMDDEAYFEHMADLRAANSLACLLYTSPSPRDGLLSRMPSSA